MTDATRLVARYNAHADRLLFELLDGIDPDLITRPAGSYFVSILGLLNHTLLAGLTWMVRFRDGGIDLPALQDPILEFEHPGWHSLLFDTYAATRDCQNDLDRLFIRLTGEWDDAGCATPFSYTTSHGESHRRRAGEVLLHVFNHATHHRGQISQILDGQGIEHDYSNLASILDEVPDEA